MTVSGRQSGHLLLIPAAVVQGKLWHILCFHSFLFHPLLPDLQQHTHKPLRFWFPSMLCFPFTVAWAELEGERTNVKVFSFFKEQPLTLMDGHGATFSLTAFSLLLTIVLTHCYPPPKRLFTLHCNVRLNAESSLLSSKSTTICPCTCSSVTPKPNHQLHKHSHDNISICKLTIWHMLDWLMI